MGGSNERRASRVDLDCRRVSRMRDDSEGL
jgi:hypothetical protein